jgi:hypothetical protein
MTNRTDDDFAREIEAHLAIETDRLIAEGLDPDARPGTLLRATADWLARGSPP